MEILILYSSTQIYNIILTNTVGLIFIPYFISNSVQLNVGGAFIDLAYLTVPVELLNGKVPSKANSTD